MKYDYRNGSYRFKHSLDETPSVYHESFQEHYHTSYELLYFLKGDAEFVIQHSSYGLSSHSLLIIKPGEYHNLIMHERKPYERIVIRFDDSDLPPVLRERLPHIHNVFEIKHTPVSEELLRIDTYMEQINEELLPALLLGQLNVILSFLCSHEKEYCLTERRVNSDMRETLDYIESHLDRIKSIEDICSGIHVSRSTLQKQFNLQLHTPIMSYVRTRQCIAANTMLTMGEPASEVARKCGFEHYSTFYRSYVKVFDKPPSTLYAK